MIKTSCDQPYTLPRPGPTEPTFFDTGSTKGRSPSLPFGANKLDGRLRGGSTYLEFWYWTLN